MTKTFLCGNTKQWLITIFCAFIFALSITLLMILSEHPSPWTKCTPPLSPAVLDTKRPESEPSQWLAQYLEHSPHFIEVQLLCCLLCHIHDIQAKYFQAFQILSGVISQTFLEFSNILYKQHHNECFVVMMIMQNIVCELLCH